MSIESRVSIDFTCVVYLPPVPRKDPQSAMRGPGIDHNAVLQKKAYAAAI